MASQDILGLLASAIVRNPMHNLSKDVRFSWTFNLEKFNLGIYVSTRYLKGCSIWKFRKPVTLLTNAIWSSLSSAWCRVNERGTKITINFLQWILQPVVYCPTLRRYSQPIDYLMRRSEVVLSLKSLPTLATSLLTTNCLPRKLLSSYRTQTSPGVTLAEVVLSLNTLPTFGFDPVNVRLSPTKFKCSYRVILARAGQRNTKRIATTRALVLINIVATNVDVCVSGFGVCVSV